nr:uncharacterized protein LOC104088573 [Nicotiana tomentosiformis]
MHKPAMLVLLKTKMADHKKLTDEIQYDTHIQFPAVGHFGGIVIMWKENILQVDEVSVTPQGIHAMVKDSFPLNSTLLPSSQRFRTNVTIWNKHIFGNIYHKKKRLLTRIASIQKSPNYQFSQFLLNLENTLIEELESILKNKEDFWKLKSRINWLSDSDANTRFFHISTLNRRKRNRILSLKDEADNWQHVPHEIKESIIKFFSALHTYSHTQSPIPTSSPNSQSHTLSIIQKASLALPLRDSEIKRASFSFKPFKAPSPNGLHPFFYQKYWDIVSKDVIQFYKDCFSSKILQAL